MFAPMLEDRTAIARFFSLDTHPQERLQSFPTTAAQFLLVQAIVQ